MCLSRQSRAVVQAHCRPAAGLDFCRLSLHGAAGGLYLAAGFPLLHFPRGCSQHWISTPCPFLPLPTSWQLRQPISGSLTSPCSPCSSRHLEQPCCSERGWRTRVPMGKSGSPSGSLLQSPK